MKVLFFPGWATTPAIFEPYYRGLAAGSFEAVDFGFFDGQAATPPPPLVPAELAPLLITEPYVVVGTSMGTLHALAAAAAFPGMVRGMLIVSGFPRFLEDDEYPAQPRAGLDAMRAQLARKPLVLLESFYRRLVHPSKIQFKIPGIPDVTRLDEGLRLLGELDMRPLLADIGCQTLIVHGAKDRIVSRACAEYMATRIPGAALTVFEEAGHALLVTHAAECRGLLTRLMEQAGPTA